MKRVVVLIVSFLALGAFAALLVHASDVNAMRCNGMAQLCDRRVDQVTFAGTHNSMAAAKEGWYAPNQTEGIPAQLKRGIHALLIDTQYWETDLDIVGQLRNSQNIAPQLQAILRGLNDKPQPGPLLCHSFCALGYRPLAEGLADIRVFLDANRNEVLIVIVENSIRIEDMDMAMRDSGLLKYAYVYDQRNRPPWPTLRELIERDERLIMFSESARGGSSNWFPYAWDYIQDTSFRYLTLESFDCEPNRGSSTNALLLVNHWQFSIIPSPYDAKNANRYDVLKRRVEGCERERGLVPNIIAVDFAERGDLLRVVRELNSGRR